MGRDEEQETRQDSKMWDLQAMAQETSYDVRACWYWKPFKSEHERQCASAGWDSPNGQTMIEPAARKRGQIELLLGAGNDTLKLENCEISSTGWTIQIVARPQRECLWAYKPHFVAVIMLGSAISGQMRTSEMAAIYDAATTRCARLLIEPPLQQNGNVRWWRVIDGDGVPWAKDAQWCS